MHAAHTLCTRVHGAYKFQIRVYDRFFPFWTDSATTFHSLVFGIWSKIQFYESFTGFMLRGEISMGVFTFNRAVVSTVFNYLRIYSVLSPSGYNIFSIDHLNMHEKFLIQTFHDPNWTRFFFSYFFNCKMSVCDSKCSALLKKQNKEVMAHFDRLYGQLFIPYLCSVFLLITYL